MQTTTIAQSPATVQTPAGIAPQTWIAAVHAETVRLRTASRNLGKRLDDAQDLVLGGALTCDADGRWHVESRTSPGVLWHANGSCNCPDAERAAPDGLCAHRLAVGITRRALKAVQGASIHPVPEAAAAIAALPEAAFSLCLRGRLDGQDAQLTIRGGTYAEFAANVAHVRGLLDAPAGTPLPASAAGPVSPTAPETPVCPTHGPMKPSSKAPGSFYCTKKLYNGSYCPERWPIQ